MIELHGRAALLMEPRTGKTKVAIDYAAMGHQAGRVRRVLVTCPTAVMDVWESEFDKHCPTPHEVLVWDRDERKRRPRPDATGDGLHVIAMNYGGLSAPQSRDRIKRAIKRYDPDLIVADESHMFKSPSAKVSRAMHSLGLICDRRLILTGTPVTKKRRVMDVYSQWKFLNPDRFADIPIRDEDRAAKGLPPSFEDFKHHYSRWIPRDGYDLWVSNRNLTDLQRRVHADAFAATRAECFDLPPRLPDRTIWADLGSSRPHYRDMVNEMLTELADGGWVEASIPLTQRLRLRELAGGVARLDTGEPRRIGGEKLTAMFDVLESELFPADEKVVVCAAFTPDIEAIVKRSKVPTWVLHGDTPRRTRTKNIEKFNMSAGPAMFVMQPSAGGLGIDLSSAAVLVWYSMTESYVDYIQATDRVALANRAVQVMHVVAKNTVDETMVNAVPEDREVAQSMLRSPEVWGGR